MLPNPTHPAQYRVEQGDADPQDKARKHDVEHERTKRVENRVEHLRAGHRRRVYTGGRVRIESRALLIRTIAASIALVAGLSAASDVRCSFPGATHECQSPGRQSAVAWREAAGNKPHELWLRHAATAQAKLLEFGRRVDVLWAPDSRTLAITDHRASDESVVWIVRTGTPGTLVSVEDAFIRALGTRHPLYKHGHRYFAARSWSSATTLVFDVRAHDAAPNEEFRGTFAYDLSGRVRQIP